LCNKGVLTTAYTAGSTTFRENRFFHWILIGAAASIVISAFHAEKTFDWFLENSLVFFGLVVVSLTYRRIALSDLSYLCLFLFMCLHEWGAHYKYSDVPLGEWMKPWLHTHRNHYDRVAHFSFGLMYGYPMQEVAIRMARVSGAWRYYLPVECTLALSAIYEMMEAGMASILSPERGEEFVGMQGDMWDSQEDMFMAGLGSVAAMLIIYAVRKRRRASAQREREFATTGKLE
jgi:putative membrane protein